MPSEHLAVLDQQQPEQSQQQIKLCSSCHRPLSVDPSNSPFLLREADETNETSIVCAPCRTRLLALRIDTPVSTARGEHLFAQVERELRRRAASLQAGNEANLQPVPINHHNQPVECIDEDIDMSDASAISSASTSSESAAIPFHRTPFSEIITPTSLNLPSHNTLTVPDASPRPQAPAYSHAVHFPAPSSSWASSSKSQPPQVSSSCPDPLVDITRLRVRSQGHHCLYPGASFQGTQKSGRNSYDVNVTIVDVDFSSSHLCGYLRIRGLTDDWPELTTYFDAEIIGSRYGFLTRNWGATEQEDMVHWARFPAFRHVRHELKKPHLTMQEADRGAVFMRWKEKFLVPDHRVQDISGASFAGFYYVCVDFNPQATGPVVGQIAQQPSLPSSLEDVPEVTPAKLETPSRARRESTNRGARRATRSPSRGAASNVATMSGFYFHQNSEPYQQLSLMHVPERTTSCFEFR